MGKKLDRVTSHLRILMIEAMQKSYNRGSDYDHGYAQGMFEAMRIMDDERMGRGKVWKLPTRKNEELR